jgi:uncharacterized protein
MIVVVDTNVWISALLFSSQTGTVYRAMQRAIAVDTLAVSQEMETELTGVLESFAWPRELIATTLFDIFGNAIRAVLYDTVHICRDPADNKFLECAERTRADLIITGDKDLLDLKSHKQTKIVTAAEYLKLP